VFSALIIYTCVHDDLRRCPRSVEEVLGLSAKPSPPKRQCGIYIRSHFGSSRGSDLSVSILIQKLTARNQGGLTTPPVAARVATSTPLVAKVWQKSAAEERKDRRSAQLWARRAEDDQRNLQMHLMMQMLSSTMGTNARGPGPYKTKGNGKGQGKTTTDNTTADPADNNRKPPQSFAADAPVTGVCSMCKTAHHKQPPPRFCRSGCGHAVTPTPMPADAQPKSPAAKAKSVPPKKQPVAPAEAGEVAEQDAKE
jgi:hypothetical protein